MTNPKVNDELQRGLRQITLVFGAVAMVASLMQQGVQAGQLLDDGLFGMIDREMLGLVFQAPLGDSVLIRLIGLALTLAYVLPIPARGLISCVGILTVTASFSFVGHGTGEPRWILSLLITAHLLAVSFWIGALWPLYKLSAHTNHLIKTAQLAHRFGRQAAVVVPLLLIAGVILVYLLVGSITLIFSTNYGLILLIKLLFVVALLTLAAVNKLRLVPRMLTGDVTAAPSLRRSIRLESLVFLIIFTATAVLTTVTELPVEDDTMHHETHSG